VCPVLQQVVTSHFQQELEKKGGFIKL
jgi:hypothetical protein